MSNSVLLTLKQHGADARARTKSATEPNLTIIHSYFLYKEKCGSVYREPRF